MVLNSTPSGIIATVGARELNFYHSYSLFFILGHVSGGRVTVTYGNYEIYYNYEHADLDKSIKGLKVNTSGSSTQTLTSH